MTPDEEQPQEIVVQIESAQKAGVWANFARVSHSPYEFTLDFIRLDFSAGEAPTGIVVSRVSVSPLFISELITALGSNWQAYAKKSLPKEVYEGDQPDDEGK